MAAIPDLVEDLQRARERREAVDRVLVAADVFVGALRDLGASGVETQVAPDLLGRAWSAFETARAAVNSKRAAGNLVEAVLRWRSVRE